MAEFFGSLSIADISVICVYIFSVIAVGIWSMFQSKRGTVDGYFLAGRFMTFIPVGMSLFASNIGSEHLVGLSGSGAAAGIGVGAFELNALLFLQLLGFVFLPVYIASGVCTLPEYIHKRFGGNRIRIFLSLLSLLLYIFTKISVNMYSGALFIQQSVGWDLYPSILSLLALTGICTVTGGLATVIYLDVLMAFVMVAGASIMTYIGFERVGGYTAFRTKYMNAVPDEVLLGNTTCGIPRADSFQLLRDSLTSDMPWAGFVFGQSTASVWYWCADQVIVQRALAAKSLSHAQGGTVLASFLKITPMFIMVIPGMISRILYPNEVGCVDPVKCMEICGSQAGCTNIAMPKLVLEVMPSGLRGLMLAVMMAALMSDLTSIFNSASTLFTMDVWKSFRKCASTRELMIVGRVFVVVLCVIGVLWVPVLKELQGGQLFQYIQAVSSYFSPPIAAVYLLAILWKRSNEKGTFWGLVVGFMAGIARMVLDFTNPAPACGEPDTRPPVLKHVHYFYFALILFVLSTLVCIVVSLATDPPTEEQLIRTTFWTRHDTELRQDEVMEEHDLQEIDEQERRQRSKSQQMEYEMKKVKTTDDGELSPERADTTKLLIDEERQRDSYSEIINSSNNQSYTSSSALYTTKHRPCWKRFVYFLCGLSDDTQAEKRSADEQRQHWKDVISLKQDPRAKRFLFVCMCLVVCISFFMQVFLSIPDGGPTKPTIEIPNTIFIANGTRPEL